MTLYIFRATVRMVMAITVKCDLSSRQPDLDLRSEGPSPAHSSHAMRVAAPATNRAAAHKISRLNHALRNKPRPTFS